MAEYEVGCNTGYQLRFLLNALVTYSCEKSFNKSLSTIVEFSYDLVFYVMN